MIWDVSFEFDNVRRRVSFVIDLDPITITSGWFSVEVRMRHYNVFKFDDMDTANRFVALVKSIRDTFCTSDILNDFYCYRCALDANLYFSLMVVPTNERQAFYANRDAFEAKCVAHINQARETVPSLCLEDHPML